MKGIALSCCIVVAMCLPATGELWTDSPTNEFERILNNINIPYVTMRQVPFSNVVAFLEKTIQDNKPATITNKIVIVLGDRTDDKTIPPIDISTKDISVFAFVSMLKRFHGLTCDMKDGVITFHCTKKSRRKFSKVPEAIASPEVGPTQPQR
jgi:hypothetical protein